MLLLALTVWKESAKCKEDDEGMKGEGDENIMVGERGGEREKSTKSLAFLSFFYGFNVGISMSFCGLAFVRQRSLTPPRVDFFTTAFSLQ